MPHVNLTWGEEGEHAAATSPTSVSTLEMAAKEPPALGIREGPGQGPGPGAAVSRVHERLALLDFVEPHSRIACRRQSQPDWEHHP